MSILSDAITPTRDRKRPAPVAYNPLREMNAAPDTRGTQTRYQLAERVSDRERFMLTMPASEHVPSGSDLARVASDSAARRVAIDDRLSAIADALKSAKDDAAKPFAAERVKLEAERKSLPKVKAYATSPVVIGLQTYDE